MPWHCSCSPNEVNPDTPCERCGKRREEAEAVFPLWQRAMRKEPDYRIYDNKSHKIKGERLKREPFEPEGW